MARPDVLLVSLGTTLGWRVADEQLLAQLGAAGAAVAAVSVRRGASDRLRRGYPVNDFVEMYAARRTVSTAVVRHEPRALIVSSSTAAMALPRLPMPYAVRFDAPARLNRPGARNAPLHTLERRAMSRACITIPFSEAGAEAQPEGAAAPVVVSPPIDPSGPPVAPEARDRLAVAYTPDAKAKGLDVVVAGWVGAAIPDARLAVYGIDPDVARAHLRRSGVPEPDSVELRGTVAAEEFRASLRRARVYVAGARWEDWGQAPLEALADGALLATVPSGGPYEGLRLARRLEQSLVAGEVEGAALALAVRAAFGLPDERMRAYQRQAAELTSPFRSAAVQETVTHELLPALLAPTPPRPPAADGAR